MAAQKPKTFYFDGLQRGFTLVELLIVIVVISILAAITVVVYGGIRERSEVVRTTETVLSIKKAFMLLKIDEGLDLNSYCLGDPNAYPSGTCSIFGSSGVVDLTLNSKLKDRGAAINTPLSKYENSYANPSGTILYVGNWMGKNKVIIYYLPDTYECGIDGILSPPFDGMTLSGAKYTDKGDGLISCFISLDN